MAPVPHRGERCHSGLVPITIARLGELRGISQEEMGRITAENACRLFQIQA
jgi:TatD DNase family protein